MTVHDVRHGRRFLGNRRSGDFPEITGLSVRFSYGLGMGLMLAALLAAGCVSEPKKDRFDRIVRSLGGGRHDTTAAENASKAVGKSAEEAFPSDSLSPEVEARRKAWKAACKAVTKALIKVYLDRAKPTFAPYPTILSAGTGRFHIFGYTNSPGPNGLLMQRAFEAWVQRHGGRTKCESLTIDGKRIR